MLNLLSRSRTHLLGERPPLWLRWMPVVVLLALIVLQVVTPDTVQLSFLIVAMPPLAALFNGPLFTAGVSLMALIEFGWFYLFGEAPDPAREAEANGLSTAVGVFLMSILMAWVRNRYSKRLVRVNTVAQAAQLALLPHVPDAIGALRCVAWYSPAEEDTMVGGDLFDVQDTSYGVRVIVGDVKGSGLDAVATVAGLLGSFREAALDDSDLDRIGARLERRMAWDNAGRDDWSASFATALLMEFPPGNREVRLATFGHPPPLLLRRGRVRELSAPPGPPLGLSGQLSSAVATVTTRLQTDDILLAFTDGITESRDAEGRFYPLADRLADWLPGAGHPTAAQVAEFVDIDLSDYGSRLHDDRALLAIRVTG